VVNKDIYFYKIEINYRNVSNDVRYPPDFTSIFQRIIDLQMNEPQNLYHIRNDGNRVLILIDTPIASIRNDSQFIRGRLIFSVKDILPPVEERGNLSDLQIPDDAALAYISHFVLFQHNNYFYLAIEMNRFGTYITSWSKYIKEKCTAFLSSVKHRLLISRKFLDLLQQGDTIKLVNMSIRKNNLSRLSELEDNISGAFNAASRVSEDIKGTIGIKISFGNGFPLRRIFAGRHNISTLISNNILRQIFSKLWIETEDGDSINILRFKYFAIIDVRTTHNGRRIDRQNFYDQIERHIEQNIRDITTMDEL